MLTPFRIDVPNDGPHRGIACLWLDQPGRPVVVLDHDLLLRLDATLDALPRDISGLVVASASERAFVAGADLKSIVEWDDPQLMAYLLLGAKVFARLATFRFPTAAAISGAALGGGLELAMHCDGLIGSPGPSRDGQPARPYPIGLPECGLAICPGWGGTNLLPARIEPGAAIMATASGTPLNFASASDAGLFDELAPDAASVIDTAREWVVRQRLSSTNPARARDGSPSRCIARPEYRASALQAFERVRAELPKTEAAAAVAKAVDTGLARGWDASVEVERLELTRLRHTPPARAAISDFLNRSAKK